MITLSLILTVIALVLFVLAGLGIGGSRYFNPLGWGLACLTLATLIGGHVLAIH